MEDFATAAASADIRFALWENKKLAEILISASFL
jgi:hypothetical protein